MDKMFVAKSIDLGIDIIGYILAICILTLYILKKRKFGQSTSDKSSRRDEKGLQ